MTRTRPTLLRLRDTDCYLDCEHDVFVWRVVLATEETIGTIEDVIIDTNRNEIRYLAIGVDCDSAGRDRQVLVPAEWCRLDTLAHVAVLSGMTAEQLATLSERDPATLTDDYDDAYRSRLSNAYPPRRATHPARDVLRVRKQPHARPQHPGAGSQSASQLSPSDGGSGAKCRAPERVDVPMLVLLALVIVISIRIRRYQMSQDRLRDVQTALRGSRDR